MIRVTVELIPGGVGEPEHLGTATISYESGTRIRGNYKATFSKWGHPNQIWRRSTVSNFPRKSRGPWDLLFLALQEAVGGRNT